jgi:putative ABC transport system permease protein
MLDSFHLSLKQALRSLLANRLYALMVITMLTLGISGTTAIFSAFNSILLRPLPYGNADRLVYVWLNETTRGIEKSGMSIPELQDYREQNKTLDGMAAFCGAVGNVSFDTNPEQIDGTRITSNLLDLLGSKPLLGRNFLAEEEVLGRNRVVIISYKLWQRRFGSNPAIINQSLTLNGAPRVIVGVMPADFAFPIRETDIWTPLARDPAEPEARDNRWLHVVALPKSGTTLDQVQADLGTVASRLQQEYAENRGVSVKVTPLADEVLGTIKLPLQFLLGATVFLLLIVCANVASLMLTRAAVREREMAIRAALGAGRGRLISQVMTESVLVALIAGLLGALLSLWFVKLLIAYGGHALPQLQEVGIDGRVLLFTAIVSLLTSVLFGLVPALQASKPKLQESLKEGGRNAVLSGGGRRLLNVLVISEITLSLILLIAVGLLVRSFVRLLQVDPGFQPTSVLTMELALTGPKYQDNSAIGAFFQQLTERVRTLPGVEAAGATQWMPLGSGERIYMFTNSQDETDSTSREGRVDAAFFQITPDYFQALGTRILRGRAFTNQDDTQRPPVAIISDRVGRLYFPNQDPVGKNIRLGSPGNWGQWLSVVGVVPDIRFEDLNKTPTMQVYTPHLQGLLVGGPFNRMVLAVRTSVDPSSLTNAVKQQVWSLDKDQPVSKIRTMSELVSESLAQRRFIMLLLVVFAGMALLLAVIGLYGTLSYMVTQRRHEIATRMALGAQQGDVLKLIIREGMMLVAIGLGIGLLMAYLLTRLVASLLFNVSSSDPFTFVGVAMLVALISLLASFVPAYKATKVEPIKVLRDG